MSLKLIAKGAPAFSCIMRDNSFGPHQSGVTRENVHQQKRAVQGVHHAEIVRRFVWLSFAVVIAAIAVAIAYSVLRALAGDNPLVGFIAFIFAVAALLFIVAAAFFSSGPNLGYLLKRGKDE